jgi:FkbM family methyltransferase
MNDDLRKREIEAGLSGGWTEELQGEYLSILQRSNRVNCGILDFRWPGISFPLYMRCGSSDLGNFIQMFVKQEYGFQLPFEPVRILDLGAYCGYAAIFLARRFPNAEIVCVEPSSANFQMLTLNTAAYSRIRRLNVAIWGHTCKLHVADTSGGDWGIRLTEGDAGSIPALSIPDVLSRVGWDRVDFLKCDIEGAELSVFRKSGAFIADMVGCCAIEIHDLVAPGSSDLVRRVFDGRTFANTESGEFEVFVRHDWRGPGIVSRVSILRPEVGVSDISLTNVENEYWAYSMFDQDSCQLHPANYGHEPAELARTVQLSGQSMFESEVSVTNEQGYAVDFVVRVADVSDNHEIVAARISVAAGEKRRWAIPLNAQLCGPHRVTMQTVMSPSSPTNHQAYANWIAPSFRA